MASLLGVAHAAAGGPPAIQNLTQGTSWPDLNSAILGANEGDDILLQPGAYTLTEEIDRGLTIRGTNPSEPAATVITGNLDVDLSGAATGRRVVLRGLSIPPVLLDRVDSPDGIQIDRCAIVSSVLGSGVGIDVQRGCPEVILTNSYIIGFETGILLFNIRHEMSLLVRQSVISDCAIGIDGLADPGGNARIGLENSLVISSELAIGLENFGPDDTILTVTNSTVRGVIDTGNSSYVLAWSNIEGFGGGKPGTGVFDADPMLVDPDGPDDNPLTLADNDYRPAPGSPSINNGDNQIAPPDTTDLDNDGNTTEPVPLDLAGAPRFIGTIDIGPLEFKGGPPPCSPVDLAEASGVLDFNDVVAFLTAFSAMDPSADLADPIGTFNFNDVISYLTLFAAGCP